MLRKCLRCGTPQTTSDCSCGGRTIPIRGRLPGPTAAQYQEWVRPYSGGIDVCSGQEDAWMEHLGQMAG